MAALLLADADTFRIEPTGTEWRRAAGADPLIAALMPLLLLLETLAQCFQQFLPTAERLDLRFFVVGQGRIFLENEPRRLGIVKPR